MKTCTQCIIMASAVVVVTTSFCNASALPSPGHHSRREETVPLEVQCRVMWSGLDDGEIHQSNHNHRQRCQCVCLPARKGRIQ